MCNRFCVFRRVLWCFGFFFSENKTTNVQVSTYIKQNDNRLVRRGYKSSKDPFARSKAKTYEYSTRIGNSYDIDGRGGSWINTGTDGVACKCTKEFTDPCAGEETVYFSNGCSKCFEYSREPTRIRGCCATALTHDAFKLGLYAVRQPEQATPLLHRFQTNYVVPNIIWPTVAPWNHTGWHHGTIRALKKRK